jgi:hypothetical protein
MPPNPPTCRGGSNSPHNAPATCHAALIVNICVQVSVLDQEEEMQLAQGERQVHSANLIKVMRVLPGVGVKPCNVRVGMHGRR